MADKEILNAWAELNYLEELLDELSHTKKPTNKQYRQIDKSFIYLDKILNEKGQTDAVQ